MKKIILYFNLFFVFALVQVALSKVTNANESLQTDDYKIIYQKINDLGKKYNPSSVLVVHDLDNTLLAMQSDLGSDQWFDWQSELLKTPQNPALVANNFDDLLKAQGLLYAVGSMRLTQNDLPEIYSALSQQGYLQILLTSRGPNFRDYTEREIIKNKIPVWDSLKSQTVVYENPYDLTNLNKSCISEQDKINFKLGQPRPISVGKNIILSSGQHKGMILKTWLCQQKTNFKAIVFADDKIKNIDNMTAAFIDNPEIELVTFRYSREDAKVKAFWESDKSLVQQQWSNLLQTLKSIF